ncbi:MAG: M48 family metallopeptidase [Bacilli bacterium]|nr:M48 family metallopeptidase [Bacilli bacterium]MBP3445599.1 M48 family metallopeptidase [Bacilli bacterium]
MEYDLNGIKVNIIIEKKNNKNTYLRVKENNQVLITTNYLTSKKTIIKLIEENKNFILKSLKKLEIKKEKEEKFSFLGKEYNIIFMNGNTEIIGNNIYTENNKSLDKWLNNEIKILFKERLDYMYNLFEENIPYPKLRIRKMKTRWGVCNKKLEVVTLNSELIKYDITKLDYVIVHELSHFVHFDHSKNFWKLVEKYYPLYKKVRKELKDN